MCIALVVMVSSDLTQMMTLSPVHLTETENDAFNDVPNASVEFKPFKEGEGTLTQPLSVFDGPNEAYDTTYEASKVDLVSSQAQGQVIQTPSGAKVYMPDVAMPGQRLSSYMHRKLPAPIIDTTTDLIGRGVDALNERSIRPRPREEPWWRARASQLGAELRGKGKHIQTLFLGDDIIESWLGLKDGNPCGKRCVGKTVFDSTFSQAKGNLASGISGDLTENMVWRIYQEGMADLNPYVIVLYLGQSDLSAGRDPTDVAGGIQACLKALNFFLPNTEFLLVGLLPRADDVLVAMATPKDNGVRTDEALKLSKTGKRAARAALAAKEAAGQPNFQTPASVSFAESAYFPKVRQVNDWLQVLANNADSVHYLDCGLQFLVPGPTSEIELSARLMPDFYALSLAGQEKFVACIRDTVEHLVIKAMGKGVFPDTARTTGG
eukprot:CAMPEP_0198201058 /NCGR_PEP_ID=MMETSP1445-20131203/3881_1 /TAXON_ID=36898 /ORGANISM="Pyramimonas sp., Strain CCMP2087" /LENGTH=435 /DNA_ID=CAMNT_0043871247 /DNA_START=415 /DNA_END=1722 /DNA_ORIENTATION=-